MLLTVSTVKDTVPNVQRFVAGNLAGGVDHMVVLLDEPDAEGQPEVAAWLDDHPHVLCLRADTDWWAGDRPQALNERQRINANALKHVLAGFDWAEWLFHVDGDEIVQVDRALLSTVPAMTQAVRLAPLEAVSRRHWDGDPCWFKPLLSADDLGLLHGLGLIARPHNDAYFHGHVDGKPGVRPTAKAWLRLHRVVGEDRRPLAAFEHESLRVLHYESYSLEDFTRKWTAMVASGPSPRFRTERRSTATAVRALLARGLDGERTAAYLAQIFERHVADDLETLRDLGMLVEAHPGSGRHVPEPLPPGAQAALGAALDGLAGRAKREFDPDWAASGGTAAGAGGEKRPGPGRRGGRKGRGRSRRA